MGKGKSGRTYWLVVGSNTLALPTSLLPLSLYVLRWRAEGRKTKDKSKRTLYAVPISLDFTLESLGSHWKCVSKERLDQIYILAILKLRIPPELNSPFERLRMLKSSFHTLPSSGKRKYSEFQGHRFARLWFALLRLLDFSARSVVQPSTETTHSFWDSLSSKNAALSPTVENPVLRTLSSQVPNLPHSLLGPRTADLSVR